MFVICVTVACLVYISLLFCDHAQCIPCDIFLDFEWFLSEFVWVVPTLNACISLNLWGEGFTSASGNLPIKQLVTSRIYNAISRRSHNYWSLKISLPPVSV